MGEYTRQIMNQLKSSENEHALHILENCEETGHSHDIDSESMRAEWKQQYRVGTPSQLQSAWKEHVRLLQEAAEAAVDQADTATRRRLPVLSRLVDLSNKQW